jgi:hypothetical protein
MPGEILVQYPGVMTPPDQSDLPVPTVPPADGWMATTTQLLPVRRRPPQPTPGVLGELYAALPGPPPETVTLDKWYSPMSVLPVRREPPPPTPGGLAEAYAALPGPPPPSGVEPDKWWTLFSQPLNRRKPNTFAAPFSAWKDPPALLAEAATLDKWYAAWSQPVRRPEAAQPEPGDAPGPAYLAQPEALVNAWVSPWTLQLHARPWRPPVWANEQLLQTLFPEDPQAAPLRAWDTMMVSLPGRPSLRPAHLAPLTTLQLDVSQLPETTFVNAWGGPWGVPVLRVVGRVLTAESLVQGIVDVSEAIHPDAVNRPWANLPLRRRPQLITGASLVLDTSQLPEALHPEAFTVAWQFPVRRRPAPVHPWHQPDEVLLASEFEVQMGLLVLKNLRAGLMGRMF